ncbi:MAG: hypothetical protein JNM69_14725 [Archangium sp.]|nr:hypothetical protein [Archangium sp.]
MFRSFLLSALAAGPALAAETVLVDSATDQQPSSPQGCVPITACVATIAQDERLFVVESGIDGRTPDGVLIHDPQTIVHATLSERAELQLVVDGLSLPFQRRSTVDIGAVQPGLKVSLLPEARWLPSQAISLHVTMPTTLDGTTDFEAWWYQSKNLGPVRLDLNLMSSLANVLGEVQVQSMGTFTVVYGVNDSLRLFAEAYGTIGQTQQRAPGVGVLSGVGLALSREVTVDVAAEVAFHQLPVPIVSGFAGFTITPGALALADEVPGA